MITIDSDATALALNLIVKERARQNEKFGDQSGNHPFEWMSILGEEFGELCQAVNETHFKNGVHPDRGGDEKIIKEAVHVAMKEVKCYECNGTGEVEEYIFDREISDTDAVSSYPVLCRDCNGTGKVSWSQYMRWCKWAKQR